MIFKFVVGNVNLLGHLLVVVRHLVGQINPHRIHFLLKSLNHCFKFLCRLHYLLAFVNHVLQLTVLIPHAQVKLLKFVVDFVHQLCLGLRVVLQLCFEYFDEVYFGFKFVHFILNDFESVVEAIDLSRLPLKASFLLIQSLLAHPCRQLILFNFLQSTEIEFFLHFLFLHFASRRLFLRLRLILFHRLRLFLHLFSYNYSKFKL